MVGNQLKKDMSKSNWQQIQEWQNDNKDKLIMVADPRDDSISISFGGLNTFVKFPGKDMEKGVVFNSLRKSKFNETIDILMTGVIQSTGMSDKEESGELLKVLGGAVKTFGEVRDNNLKNKNGKK